MADGEQQKPTGSTKPVLKKRKLTSGGINTEDNSETTLTKTPESQIKTSKHFESDLTGITSEEFTTKAKELGIVISYELAQAAERQAHNVGFDQNKLPGQTAKLLENTYKIVEAIKSNITSKPSSSLESVVNPPAKDDKGFSSYVSQEKYLELKKQYDDLTNKSIARDNALTKARGDRATLEEQIKTLESQLTGVQTKPEDAISQDEYDKLRAEYNNTLKAFKIATDRKAELEEQLKTKETEYPATKSKTEELQTKYNRLLTDYTNLKLDIAEYKSKIENLESQLNSVKPSEGAVDESQMDLLNELKAAKEQLKAYEAKFDKFESENTQHKSELIDAYGTISILEDTVKGLENRLHEHNVATAGGVVTETEAVFEGQEFSRAYSDAPVEPSYELHLGFGLVSIADTGMRYQPDTNGYLFDVDRKQRIHVGEDYKLLLDIHNRNVEAHIYGESKPESKDFEDLPTDSEE